MGPHWLECLDEQGVFYFNQMTQQSSDTLPAELGGLSVQTCPGQPQANAMPYMQQQASSYAPPQAMQLPSYTPPQASNCHPQTLSYSPQQLPQPYQAQQIPSYTPPQVPNYQPQLPQACQTPLPYQAQQAYHPHGLHLQQIPPNHFMQSQPMPQAHQPIGQPMPQGQPVNGFPSQQARYQQVVPSQPMPPPGQQPAVQKVQFGDWAVYEDNLGRFFMYVPTGQQFESPPPEFMEAFQQHRAEQDRLHFQQLQRIELEKQRVDQQLLQRTQALHQECLMVPVQG
jgi:hypothetical protein